jgi:hypothetical protein
MSRSKKRDLIKRSYYVEPDLFGREKEDSGKTTCILGRSFSGKTHFLVDQLNEIADRKRGGNDHDRDRPMYDLIILMTESLDAQPLKGLRAKVKIVRSYVPSVIKLLKQMQDASKCAFRFLVILDDCISNIRGGTFAKQILTLRNSNISTTFLIQYVKLVTPSIRNSVHSYFLTGLKPEEYSYLGTSFLSSHMRDACGPIKNMTELSKEFKEWVDTDICFYDQRKDELNLIKRDAFL